MVDKSVKDRYDKLEDFIICLNYFLEQDNHWSWSANKKDDNGLKVCFSSIAGIVSDRYIHDQSISLSNRNKSLQKDFLETAQDDDDKRYNSDLIDSFWKRASAIADVYLEQCAEDSYQGEMIDKAYKQAKNEIRL